MLVPPQVSLKGFQVDNRDDIFMTLEETLVLLDAEDGYAQRS